MKISIAIPCYNSSKTIGDVVKGIENHFNDSKYECEIILVNDGSKDNTFERIYELSQLYSNVIGINLSKNFGQSAAKMAAIPFVTGDILIYMDDDGQHPIDGINKLIDKINEGNDLVYAKFINKKHNGFKKLTSKLHNWLLYKSGSKPKDITLSSFFAISGFSIKTLQESECPVIAVAGYLRKVTNKIANVDMQHLPRKEGKSGYSLSKLFALWKKSITSFNTAMLQLAMNIGAIFGLLGILIALYTIINKIMHPSILMGYTSLIATVLICSGALMLLIGILGEYIGKMYLIMCKLPPFKIRTVVNNKDEKK